MTKRRTPETLDTGADTSTSGEPPSIGEGATDQDASGDTRDDDPDATADQGEAPIEIPADPAEPVFDECGLELPRGGGSWVRQEDGTLTRSED